MNRLTLIEKLKVETGFAKTEAAAVTDLFFTKMSDALATSERIELRGLCSFHVKDYPGYTGRNPKTGKRVKIQPKKLPFFKCGKELKDRVDR
jgi:integration host factor subunit beta